MRRAGRRAGLAAASVRVTEEDEINNGENRESNV